MSANEFTQLRTRLEAERDRLETAVRQIEAQDRESTAEAVGETVYRDHSGDPDLASFDLELDMSLEENLRRSLAEVRAALARMEDGSYGACHSCREQIPEPRLEAVPTASLCISCKEAEESL
jgi:DnaK suppressor protein